MWVSSWRLHQSGQLGNEIQRTVRIPTKAVAEETETANQPATATAGAAVSD